MEVAILVWFAVGAGIAAGAFLLVRAAVQLGAVVYAYLEKRLDAGAAARQTAALSLVMLGALLATAVIAAIAILALFASLLSTYVR